MTERIEITRPKIFPECKRCPVVERIINAWSKPPTSVLNKSVDTKLIKVECFPKTGYTLLSESTVLMVLPRRARKARMEVRETPFPHTVPCLHFTKMMSRCPPVQEPE